MEKDINQLLDRANRTGSIRDTLKEEAGLEEVFKTMSPEEKSHGKLIGKILASHGNVDIESAFTWFEQEYNGGNPLDWRHKMLTIFQAAETLGCDQEHYNLIRKMYLTVNNR